MWRSSIVISKTNQGWYHYILDNRQLISICPVREEENRQSAIKDQSENPKEKAMAHPTHYKAQVTIPLPSDAAVRRIIGNSYDPEKTLNVIKMFAGTEDMFDATI